MRSADGFTKAVTRAEALGYSIPQVAATGPGTPLAGDSCFSCDPDGTEGGPTAPTSAQWHNSITEEIATVLQLGNVAAPGGLALDPADNTQMAQVIGPIRALHSGSADTTQTATVHTRALLAAEGKATGDSSACACTVEGTGEVIASGAASAVIASITTALAGQCKATASQSAIIACHVDASIVNVQAGADTSAIVASRATGASAVTTATGAREFVAACDGTSGGVSITGNQAAAIACDGADVSGNQAAAIACLAATVTASNSAAIACPGGVTVSTGGGAAAVAAINATITGTGAAAIAAGGAPANILTVSGGRAAAIGCSMTTAVNVAGNNDVMLASAGSAFAPSAAGQQVYGGTGGMCKWRIDSTTGSFYSVAGGGGLTTQAPSFNMAGADFAEYFARTGDVPARRLVTVFGGIASIAQPGSRVHGVSTDRPGIVGNNVGDTPYHERARTHAAVALLGQVEVEVLSDVMAGDYLVPGPDGRGIPTDEPPRTGRPVEVLCVREPFGAEKGYGLALCLVG